MVYVEVVLRDSVTHDPVPGVSVQLQGQYMTVYQTTDAYGKVAWPTASSPEELIPDVYTVHITTPSGYHPFPDATLDLRTAPP